jgi:hypothetical protein
MLKRSLFFMPAVMFLAPAWVVQEQAHHKNQAALSMQYLT